MSNLPNMKTYDDLKVWVNSLSEEQLGSDLTIEDENEEIIKIELEPLVSQETEILDANHPYFKLRWVE